MSANTYSIDLESGSSQYLYINDASQTLLDFTANNAFTLEVWVNLESQPATGNQFGIIAKNDRDDTTGGYLLRYQNVSGTQYIYAFVRNSTLIDEYYWTQTLTSGTWYHIALT